MKLVFIVDQYPPAVDGVGDYTFNMVAEYCKRGNEVVVICRKNNAIDTVQTNGSAVLPIVTDWNYKEFTKVAGVVNSIKPTWVLLQYVPNAFQKKGMPVWLPSALKKIDRNYTKILLTIHEPFIRFQIWPLKLFLLGATQRWIIKKIGNLSEKIVVSIDLYKKFVAAYSQTAIDIVPIGSNINPVEISREEIIEKRLKIAPKREKIISTFGVRDHVLLLDVFKHVLQIKPAFKLLICGVIKNPDLYKGMENDIYVTGFLASQEIFTHLSCSDVFFLPDAVTTGNQGGTSNKSGSLAAAFSANIPVVGIKGDMNNELLKKNTACYLEDGNDAGTIARRIVQIALSDDYKNESYLFWENYLAWSKIADNYHLE